MVEAPDEAFANPILDFVCGRYDQSLGIRAGKIACEPAGVGKGRWRKARAGGDPDLFREFIRRDG